MISRVVEDPLTKNLNITYLDENEKLATETFDMVVLAVGLKTSEASRQMAERLGLELNESHFCSTDSFEPVQSSRPGVFVAGMLQGPKDIPDSVAQAGAAAAEALALIDAQFVELEPYTAFVLEEDCSGCKSCIPLCPYQAISFVEEKKKATINEVLCKGCGTCVAGCPSGSIQQNFFEDQEIFEEIEGVLAYA